MHEVERLTGRLVVEIMPAHFHPGAIAPEAHETSMSVASTRPCGPSTRSASPAITEGPPAPTSQQLQPSVMPRASRWRGAWIEHGGEGLQAAARSRQGVVEQVPAIGRPRHDAHATAGCSRALPRGPPLSAIMALAGHSARVHAALGGGA